MTNKVFVNDEGVIECMVVGNQTADTIAKMGEDIAALLGRLKAQNHPLLVLDDIVQIGQVPPEGRQAVISLAKTLQYDRLAMLGNNGLLRLGANLMLRASGRSSKLRYFTNRQQAVKWLRAGSA